MPPKKHEISQNQRNLLGDGLAPAEKLERTATEAGKVSVYVSAKIVHTPQKEKADRAVDLRGVGSDEADLIAGFSEKPKWSTPGTTPSEIDRAVQAKNIKDNRHNAHNPSDPSSKQKGQIEVAEIRRREQLRREADARLKGEGEDDIITPSNLATLPALEADIPETPPRPQSAYERSRSKQPSLPSSHIDEAMLRS